MERRLLAVCFGVAAVFCAVAPARAGQVALKNGTELEGDLVEIKAFDARLDRQQSGEIPTTPYLLIDGGYRRYIVGDRQVAPNGIDRGRTLVGYDFFELPQKKSHTALPLASVGLPKRVADFDAHGVRTVTFNTNAPGGRLDVVQGVTKIGPEYVTVEGINFTWWQGIGTAAMPTDQLAAMVRTAIDPADPEDRMSAVRFFIRAGLYEPAAAELEAIRREFPFLAAKADEFSRDLLQMRARLLLAELRARQEAGQHGLALAAAESFPTGLGFDAEVLRQVEELRQAAAADRERRDTAVLLLGELEAGLDDAAERTAVAELRPVLLGRLDRDGLGRLEAFLKLAEDDGLKPREKLALAYTGWVVGSAKASTDLPTAIGLWRARQAVLEYLRNDDAGRRAELLAEVGRIEGVGPGAVADLIPGLPAWVETPEAEPGRVLSLKTVEQVRGWGGDPEEGAATGRAAGPVGYAAVLPPEYTSTRSYPLLVALRPAEWSTGQAATFWGVGRDGAGREAAGPATRAGYVVVAPGYAGEKQAEFGYTAREHEAVLAVIRDAKKRFVIDSDRVYVTGHGMGADATFDVAMAHPDLFAGAAPISGLSRHVTKHYWQNAERVPFYVVNGEVDRNARSVNANELSRMMKAGHDVTYCEYVGRGYEYYQEELGNVLAWMGRLRRAAEPKEVEARVLRASDDRFYWVEAEGIPRSALAGELVSTSPQAPARAMTLTATIRGNTVTLGSAARRYVLRLNGGLIDLDKRLEVRVRGKQVFNDFVAADTAALLDELAADGDRQRLCAVRVTVE